MLTEQQIELFASRIQGRLTAINEQYLEMIGKRIKEIGAMSATDLHRLKQMKSYGSDVDKIVQQLAIASNKIITDIYDMFEIVAKDNYNFSKQFYDARNVPFVPYEKNKTLQKYVSSIAEQTVLAYKNLTQHTAFMVFGKDGEVIPSYFPDNKNKVPTTLSKTYTKVIDLAVTKAQLGMTSYQSAMRETLRAMADSGIKTADYATGHTRRLDTAVRQNVLWGIKQCNQGVADITGREFGADGYEISYHSHPRPSHVDMGGKQYSQAEFKQQRIDDLLNDYGCLHFKFSILCGISSPAYSTETLAKFKSNDERVINFEGKDYTMYEASQLQAKTETAIRKAKDRQILAKASGDDTLRREEQYKVNVLTSKYTQLCDTSGLPTRAERMSVSGFRKVNIIKDQKSIAKKAKKIYNLDNEDDNIKAFIRDKQTIDLLEYNNIKVVQKINEKEFVVETSKPKIKKLTQHALDNLNSKPDRKSMTIETAQNFVDNSNLTLYNTKSVTIKYLSENGYSVLNFDNDLVTAVPQKWRNKYNKYLNERG